MMDQDLIEQKLMAYRSLSPDALAELDENRHQLAGEEAVALDRIMADPAFKTRIAQAILELDLRKRWSFRLRIGEYILIGVFYWALEFAVARYRPWGALLAGALGLFYYGYLREQLLRLAVRRLACTTPSVAEIF
jgi:hypothetical protein